MRQSIALVFGLVCAGTAQADIPPELAETLATLGMPAEARTEAEAGKAPVWVLERDTNAGEISVVGVVKLASPPRQIADDFFGRNSMLESDILKESGTFSDPAALGDVAKYRVSDSDLEVLADCEIHACKFKLGARALEGLGAIDWDSPDARRKVDELVRRRMVAFVTDYQKEGRAALGRYLDKPAARSVPEATDLLLDQIKGRIFAETVRSHFRDYPKSRLRGARDRIYWNVRDYGYRPVTSIVHTVALEPGGSEPAELVAAETLYSSHYFDARLQLLALYTDTADQKQTYALYVDRLLFDGEVGSIQRRMLRSGVVDDLRKRLGGLGQRYRSP